MKKNGFTLIEIISSVVILVMLILIATPAILNLIDEAGFTTNRSVKERLIDATKVYVTTTNRNILNSLVELGDKRYIKSDRLIQHGLITKNTVDLLEEDPVYVSVELKEDNKVEYKVEFDPSLIADNKPYILIIGDNPYFLTVGTEYNDSGAVAFDKDGNNISSNIEKTGTVNNNTIGSYTIEYKVTDSENIESDIETRTVYVIDATLPEVTNTTMTSNNALNNNYAKNGDTITLNMTFSKEISNQPIVKIGGRTATVTGSGTSRTATYTIPNNEEEMDTGELSISIENYQDIYTNSGPTFTNIITGEKVTYLTRGPIITFFYVGGLDNPRFTTTNTTLYSNVSGAYQMCFSNTTSCSNWVNYNAVSDFILTSGGGIKTVYAWYRDHAGNVTQRVSDTAEIDTEAPICVSSGGSTAWTSGNRTLTGTCDDQGGSGCVSATVTKTYSSNINSTTESPGEVCDIAGNCTTCPANQTVRIDKNTITCTSSGGSTAWTSGNRTITGTCNNSFSPCSNVTKTYSSDINSTTESPGQVCNSAGSCVTCPSNRTVRIDKTAPTIVNAEAGTMRYRDPTFASGTNSVGVYNNSGGGTVVHARVSLTTPVGSHAIRITTSGTASPGLGGFRQLTTSQANRVYMHRIIARIPVGYTINRHSNSVGTGGTHTWLTPRAGTGNWEEYIYITRAGSSGTFSTFGHVAISGTAGTASNPVVWHLAYATIYDTQHWGRTGSIVFNATDAGSGITGYGINTSSTTAPTFTTISSRSSFGVSLGNYTSNNTYYVWVRDALGNTRNRAVTLNRIDRTNPTCVSSGGSTAWTNGNRTITGTCSDTGGSGCVGNVTRTYSTNTNTTTASPGQVCDHAGNCVTCPANRTVRIDKNTISCTSSGGSTAWTSGNRTITGTCNNSYSPCANVTRTYSTTTNTTTASPGQVCNSAGSCATCPSNRTVRVDKTIPATFSNQVQSRTLTSINIRTTNASDADSGLHSTAYSFSRNGGSTWTSYQSGNSYNFTGLSGGTSYSMRIRVRDAVGNVRTGSTWSASTRSLITSTYAVTSQQMYRGSAGTQYNSFTDQQIQGTYDGSLTNTRNSLFLFNHSTIRSNLLASTTDRVRLRMRRINTAHGNAGTGYVRVLTHNYTSFPSSWYGSGLTHRGNFGYARGEEKYVTLPNAVGDGFRLNTIKGMAFFTTSTHQWNYYVRMERARTLLEIRYIK